MPFCPNCETEYRPGFTTCAECRVPLVPELEPRAAEAAGESGETAAGGAPTAWVKVHTGLPAVVERIEAILEGMHVPYARLPEEGAGPEEDAGSDPARGIRQIGPAASLWAVAVPVEVYERFDEAIDRAVHAGRLAAGDIDEQAAAHAEEGYDVRGCPTCRFFFSEEYEVCPGDDVDLVPAVEIFEDGQLTPDRVIVADGDGAAIDAVAVALKSAGFDAESFEVDGWAVTAVDVAWADLSQRAAEVEAVLAPFCPSE